MSNYKNDSWCETWDALSWNFIKNESNFFMSNPRLSMMTRIYNKMSDEKKKLHEKNTKEFFNKF